MEIRPLVAELYFYPFLVSCAKRYELSKQTPISNFMEIRPVVAELYFYPFLI
jgi:hypothetical protein